MLVVIQDRGSEARGEEVDPAVIVVIEPDGIGHDRERIIAAAYAGRVGDLGECEIAVVVIEVILAARVGIGHEEVVEAVVIVVADSHGCAAGGEHPEDVGALAVEDARVMGGLDAGFGRDLFEVNFARRAGENWPYMYAEERDQRTS